MATTLEFLHIPLQELAELVILHSEKGQDPLHLYLMPWPGEVEGGQGHLFLETIGLTDEAIRAYISIEAMVPLLGQWVDITPEWDFHLHRFQNQTKLRSGFVKIKEKPSDVTRSSTTK